jgi:two-component system, cell cycle response regulator
MGREEITVVTESLGEKGETSTGTPCLVVFYGKNIGHRHELDKSEVIIGRSDSANLQVDQESVSRQHCKILTLAGRSSLSDLGSTNGTFVNDDRIDTRELRDGDLLRIGQTIFKYLSGSNIETKYHEEIYRLTTIDGLTQAYNKRYFLETLEREVNRATRYGRVLSLVLFDIDHFKKINDSFGHLAGDYVLRELAVVVNGNLRREDVFARYGGEEFAIILPEIDHEGSKIVCEKVRRKIELHLFKFGADHIPVTTSFGIRTLGPSEKIDTTRVIAEADAKLYEAKQGGRNRVCA